jgi:hypothetical protein
MVAEVVASISLFWAILVVLVASLGYFQVYIEVHRELCACADTLADNGITRPSALLHYWILQMALLQARIPLTSR